jgi:C1A family cysteine protease
LVKKALSLALLAAVALLASTVSLAQEPASHGTGLMLHERQRKPFVAKAPKMLAPLPARFDWREQGKVTPVKDQSSCGACYAFASIADFESKILLSGGDSFDFSENSVKECEFYHRRCSGGTYWFVANYLSAKGTVLESCDHYQPTMTGCNPDCPYVKTLLDWRSISEGWVAPTNVLKAYVATYGPVFVGLYAGNHDAWEFEFANYDGSYVLYYDGGAKLANHAGLICGWDDNLSWPGGEGAWIVKNSWGTAWGGTCDYGDEGGYYYMAYGSALIGQASSFLYEWQDYDPTGRLFYYDEGGYTKGFGYGASTTGWAMCRFIPDVDVLLQRVEFWSFDPVLDADIYLYDHFDGGALSGLRASRLDYFVDFMGYHSVLLPSETVVTAGDTICVVMKITAESDTMPIPVDRYGPRAPGRCFTSPDGSTWSELTTGDIGVRLRATGYVDIIPPELSIGIGHDGGLPREIDVYVASSEEIDPASLAAVVLDDTLTMERVAGEAITYRGHHVLSSSGLVPISAEARDWVGNPGSAAMSLEASEITASGGGAAASVDSLLEISVGRGVLTSDAYFLVSELEVDQPHVTRAYEVTPSGLSLGDFAELSIAYDDTVSAPEHLCIARLDDGEPTALTSFVDSSRHRIVTYVDSLGRYGLYGADGVSSGVIGSGVLGLQQNSPNPFRGSTAIIYEMPRSGHLALSIFAVDGRLVKTLVDGEVTRGMHRLEWAAVDSRGKSVASGVYFLKAESAAGGAMRKLVVVN